MPQQQFKGYSQDQMGRIASKLGHTGGLDTFDNYLNSNSKALGKYNALKDTIVQQYARGGMVKSSGYAEGGDVSSNIQDLFQSKLGRAAGREGADYYQTKYQTMLDANIDPATAMSVIGGELQNSTEGKQRAAAVAAGNTDFQRYVSAENQIPTIGGGGFNRDGTLIRPAPDGIDYRTTDQPIDALGRIGDNTAADTAAIQQMYQNNLGRAAGTAGANEYAKQMAAGTNLDTIRGEISGSTEAGEYNKTGQQQYVGADNQIDGVTYNPVGTGNVGTTPPPVAGTPIPNPSDGTAQPTAGQSLGNVFAGRATAPGLVAGANAIPQATTTATNQIIDSTASKLTANEDITNKDAALVQANTPTVTSANTATTTKTGSITPTVAAQSSVADNDKVTAQTQATTNVGDINAAQSSSIDVTGAPTRTLAAEETVQAVANSQTAAAFTEQIQAASADPSLKATVQGQLATLMTSFDEGNTPAWAAGAMRDVTATMAARGIGSSSMAGQALIQAALETALPIATADAQTFASFEMTNLNNRQQRAMLSAQQRATFMGQEFDQKFQARVITATKVSEVANMRFTAAQSIALENSQAANTMNLNNLSNKQAIVMAAASTMSQLEVGSLNNRQQAEVQNAQSFLDMNMSNLSNSQQATMFDAQSRIQAMLTDTAADNATKQFNATSENQTDQFFSNLKGQISQFNATQANAQAQFNKGETNGIAKFNKEISNQRDQFNAQNRLVIDQSNAQWRRNIATADTAATNRANEVNAKAVLDISNSAYNDLWQDYKDKSEWAWTSAESGRDRFSKMALQQMVSDSSITIAQIEADYKTSVSAGEGLAKLFLGNLTGSFLDFS